MPSTHNMLVVAATAVVLLSGACSDGSPVESGDSEAPVIENPNGSCVGRIKFEGHVFIDRRYERPGTVEQGRRLGSGEILGCSASDTDKGAGDTSLAVYEAVGHNPKDAVLVEGPSGLMELATGDELLDQPK